MERNIGSIRRKQGSGCRELVKLFDEGNKTRKGPAIKRIKADRYSGRLCAECPQPSLLSSAVLADQRRELVGNI